MDLYVTHSAADLFRVAHAPERCYTGSGWRQAQRDVATLRVGDRDVRANRMVFTRSGVTTLVYAWYRLEGGDVPDHVGYRIGTFLRQVRVREAGGAMVRLSTPVGVAGLASAEERVHAFCAEALGPALAPLEERR